MDMYAAGGVLKFVQKCFAFDVAMALLIILLCPFCAEAQVLVAGKNLADFRWDYWSKQLDESSPLVRSVALDSLTLDKENLDRAYPLIAERLEKEQSADLHVEVIEALGRCGAEGGDQTRQKVADTMLALLKSASESQPAKKAALSSVLTSRDPRACPLLRDLLVTGDDSQVEFALHELCSFPGSETESAVVGCLQREHTAKKIELVKVAIKSLADLKATSAVQPLLDLLRADLTIRGELVEALDIIQPKIGSDTIAQLAAAEDADRERQAAAQEAERQRATAEQAQLAQQAADRAAKEQAEAAAKKALIDAWDKWEVAETKVATTVSSQVIASVKQSHDAKFFKVFCNEFGQRVAAGRGATMQSLKPALNINQNNLIQPLDASVDVSFIGADANQAWYFEFKLNDDESMWEISVLSQVVPLELRLPLWTGCMMHAFRQIWLLQGNIPAMSLLPANRANLVPELH